MYVMAIRFKKMLNKMAGAVHFLSAADPQSSWLMLDYFQIIKLLLDLAGSKQCDSFPIFFRYAAEVSSPALSVRRESVTGSWYIFARQAVWIIHLWKD